MNKEIELSNLCKVCDGLNARMNYGVLCCSSCKIFFRRNAKFDLKLGQCVFGDGCDIKLTNRRTCKYCRLKKCFFIGMNKELIRNEHIKPNKRKKCSIPIIISTIDLLCNDRSLLNLSQWSLLTNINNSYDDKSLILTVNNIIDIQSKQSSKIRFKMATTNYIHITNSCFLNARIFMNKIPQFQLMSINDQNEILQRNIYTMGGISGIILLHEIDIYQNSYYYNTAINIFGLRIIQNIIHINYHADSNGLLLKLFLSILAFSTSTDILQTDINKISSSNNRVFSNTKLLFEIQNIYIELLFKYMLFRFGYKETILRFFGLVKTSLHLSTILQKSDDTQTLNQLVETITKETEQSFILHQQIME